MKRCPSCEQTYDDDALSFCPADGTRLEIQKSSSMDLQATIMAPPPPSPPPLSQSFTPDSLTGYETNVTPNASTFEPTPQPPTQTPSWESIPTATPPQQQFTAPPAPAAAAARDAKRPKPMAAYITIGASILIAGFLLFVWLIGLIAGIGGNLIHLLLVLALLIGFIGIAVGIFLLVMNKRQ
jgi:hypothetical protein